MMRKSNLGRNVIIAALFSIAVYGLYVITKGKDGYEGVKSDCEDLRGRLSDIRNRIDMISNKITVAGNKNAIKKQELYFVGTNSEEDEILEDEAELE